MIDIMKQAELGQCRAVAPQKFVQWSRKCHCGARAGVLAFVRAQLYLKADVRARYLLCAAERLKGRRRTATILEVRSCCEVFPHALEIYISTNFLISSIQLVLEI